VTTTFPPRQRQELALGFLTELIARDRNRACVIGWSVANEPRMNHPEAAAALRSLCDAARALDGTRPVGYATDLPDAPGVDAASPLRKRSTGRVAAPSVSASGPS
jgi:beta-galactosidase/beta-glucuronidase